MNEKSSFYNIILIFRLNLPFFEKNKRTLYLELMNLAMKKIVFIFVSLCLMIPAFSQQNPLSGQYMFTPMVLNPAYAGFHDMVSTTASYRQQWRKMQGGPETSLLNVHSSLPIDKMGAGLTIIRDAFGIQHNTEVTLAGSYKIKMEHNTFAFGLQGGFVNYSLRYDELLQKDLSDDLFNGGINQNLIRPNFGFGAMYLTKRYFVGLSVPRILETNSVTGHSMYLRHYYGMLGYIINLRQIKIKPSILIKAYEQNGSINGRNISIDLNASILLYNKLWAGVSLRDVSDFAVMAQLQLSRYLKVGYSFEIPFNEQIRKAGGGSLQIPTHELMLNVNLKVLDVQAVQGFLF